MSFTNITINDKKLFDDYFKVNEPQISELTFTNLFMWRNYYRYVYDIICGQLCIIANPLNSEPYALMHVAKGTTTKDDIKEAVNCIREYFRKNGWVLKFKKMAKEETELLKDIFGLEYGKNIIEDRDNSDYVYRTEDLIYLKGKKYDGKRNHINKFKKMYSYEYYSIDDGNIRYCYDIMDEWCRKRDCKEHMHNYCEKLANIEVLDNYKTLGCDGAIISVNGKFEAFAVGEMLNSTTAVIHIEKANTDISGLYAVINQQFCEKRWSSTAYINREQDLGVEGIRKAKLSYNPLKVIEKYTILL